MPHRHTPRRGRSTPSSACRGCTGRREKLDLAQAPLEPAGDDEFELLLRDFAVLVSVHPTEAVLRALVLVLGSRFQRHLCLVERDQTVGVRIGRVERFPQVHGLSLLPLVERIRHHVVEGKVLAFTEGYVLRPCNGGIAELDGRDLL